MTTSSSTNGVSMPDMVSIKATEIAAPPGWALMERNLIDLMEEAAPIMVKKYTEPGGALYFAEDYRRSVRAVLQLVLVLRHRCR